MKFVRFNPGNCMSCKSCQLACAIEHSKSKTIFDAVCENPKPVTRLQLKFNNSSVSIEKCLHCDSAQCIKQCPSQALHRDSESNCVVIDYSRCKACGICVRSCENNAFFKFDKVIFKCDGCQDRVKRGLNPACVSVCKTGALLFSEQSTHAIQSIT